MYQSPPTLQSWASGWGRENKGLSSDWTVLFLREFRACLRWNSGPIDSNVYSSWRTLTLSYLRACTIWGM